MRSAVSLPEDPTTRPAPPASLRFWKAYWTTLRPYLFFVSGASGLVGLALAPELGWGALLAAFGAFFFSYGLGQAVTDVFQIDTDSISSPYRPLVRGEVTRAHVLTMSLAGLALCGVVLGVLNPVNLALAALAVAGLVGYTWFKRRWWAGPFWNAWIVALLPLMGFLCGGATLATAAQSRALAAVMTSVFFSYAVFVLLGYFKDVSADRVTGYRTLPVVAGRGVALAVSALFAAAAAVAGGRMLAVVGALAGGEGSALLGGEPFPSGPGPGIALWAVGIAMLAWGHLAMFGVGHDDEAHRGIVPVVRGHVVVHLGLAAAVRPELVPLALLVWGLFEVALSRRPEVAQI